MFKKFFNLFKKKKDNSQILFDKLYLHFNNEIISLDENKHIYCNVCFQINDSPKQVIRSVNLNGTLIFQFELDKAMFFHSEKESFSIIYLRKNIKNILYGKFNNTDLSKDINLFTVKEFSVNKDSISIEVNKNRSFEVRHDKNKFKIWFDIN